MISVDRLMSALMDAAADAIVVINENGYIRHFSPSASRLFGYSSEDCVGQNVSILMPNPDRDNHNAYIENYIRGNSPKIIGQGRKVKGLKSDGTQFPMHLSVGEAIVDSRRYFVGICHDLTEYEEAINRLTLAEQRYRDVVQNQSELICRIDKDLNLTFVSPSFGDLFNISDSNINGTSICRFLDNDNDSFIHLLTSLFDKDSEVDSVNVKISMKGHDGPVPVDWTFRRLVKSGSYENEVQGFGVDVSERDAAINHANFLLQHDQLTGILNKRSFSEKLQSVKSTDERYALVHLDFENFSLINHRFGFEVGDSVIRQASRRVREVFKSDCVFCRPGGDDFLVLIPVAKYEDLSSYIPESVTSTG